MYYICKYYVILLSASMPGQEKITPIEQYVIDFVRKLRTERRLTQGDIGNIIGASQVFIANVESSNNRAKYNLSHINMLADHFGFSPRDFLPEKAL